MDWYVIDVNPEPWEIGPVGVGRKSGKMWAYVGRNQALYAYQQAVKESVVDPVMVEGELYIEFFFWRQVTREDRANYADTTNLQKATEDALQEVLYANDRRVVKVSSTLMAQGPEVEGRVVVGISNEIHAALPPAAELAILEHTASQPQTSTPEVYDEVEDVF